jgi:hypothetical protein
MASDTSRVPALTDELDPALAQVIARRAIVFARDLAVMTHPEFLEATREGLEEQRRGEGIPWEEVLRQLGRA